MGPAPLGVAEGQERFPHLGKILTGREINWDRRGASGSQRRVQQLVCVKQDRVRPT